MVAYTTTYNLKKPTVADDEDVWGGYLNDSMDIIDDVLDGTVPVTGIDINSGTLDNVVIGGTTANTGTFTVLSATTSLGVTGNITVSGTVDGVDIAARDAVLTSTTTTANAALPKAGGTMTGAITFAAGQTFDGRDVSADGAKLDGIESGATADQTKADIDALGIAASTAATLATARNIALTGDVTGNVNFDGSGNVSITTTIADDSHNHVISNVDGLQTALDGKLSTSGKAADSNLLDGIDSNRFVYGDSANKTTNVSNVSTALPSGFYDGNSATGTPTSTWYTYINARHNNTANNYGSQIACSFYSTQDFYVRNINNGSYSAWAKIWNSSNDGAGSGLDADLWDGNQFSSYLNQAVLTTSAPTFGDVYNNGWFRNNQSGEGLYNQATTQHFYSDNDDWWNVAGGTTANGIRFRDEHNGTIRGAVYADSSNGIGFLDSDQQWAYRHYRDSRHEWLINNTEYMQLDSSGLFLHDGSLREDYDALSGTSPTCNVNSGGAFSLSMSGNTTFTFTSPTSGYSTGFVLQLTGNGGTVTWPASVDWAGGTAPDAPASGETDIYVFWTRDGGTTWYGVQSIDAAA